MNQFPPPFIASQQIDVLHAPPGRELEYLELEAVEPESEFGWKLHPNREHFFGDPKHRRLLLTVTGGIGKSTALDQIDYLLTLTSPRQVTIWIEVAELPASAEDYLEGNLLVSKLRHIPYFRNRSSDEIRRWLRIYLNKGWVAFLIDALDQVDLTETPGPSTRLRQLSEFINHFPKTQYVVTGRPYSVRTYWKHLFTDAWTIARVSPFTSDQAWEYLGDDISKQLERLEADVLSVPRALKRLKKLTLTELARLRTAADVYWEFLKPILTLGCADQEVDLDVQQATQLFALIAYEMVYQDKGIEIKAGKPYQEFGKQVLRDRKKLLEEDFGVSNWKQFRDLLKELGKLNIVLRHAVHDSGLERIRWQDRTLQDMFAAIWVCRYGSGREQPWLANNQVIHRDESTSRLQEFWKLLVGMPNDSGCRDAVTWVGMVSGLFHPQGVRSTELMFRAWPRLLELAGHLKQDWSEDDVRAANTRLQRDVYQRVKSGLLRFDAEYQIESVDTCVAAQQVIDQFLGEFPAILFQGHVAERDTNLDWFTGSQSAHELARQFFGDGDNDRGQFLEIPAGQYRYGDAGEIRTQPVPFELCRYQLTNELYALFAPHHPIRFGDYREDSRSGGCPVIFVNWYDSWVSSLWFHCQLPDEFQWERACRGARDVELEPERWSCGTEDELKRAAWYSGHPGEGEETQPVGQLEPNSFGLYDMHGNVWEWCENLYSAAGTSRVFRGGAFYDYAVFCRSAFSYRRPPTFSSRLGGLRLSRAHFLDP